MTIGTAFDAQRLVLTLDRDFRYTMTNLDEDDNPINFPSGSLFFQLQTSPSDTNWVFTISGAVATLKVESTVVNTIPRRTKWQLVWLPTGESAGGDPLAIGFTDIQG